MWNVHWFQGRRISDHEEKFSNNHVVFTASPTNVDNIFRRRGISRRP